MTSNTINPLQHGEPREVVAFLQKAADLELSTTQRKNAEIIVSQLGTDATVLKFVDAALISPGLRQFGVKVGACCLPGEGYAELYKREYGALES